MSTAPDWITAVGGVTALLAAIYAIFQQGRELKLQREELAAQREELARTVEIQKQIVNTDRLRGYLDLQVQLVAMGMSDPDLRRSERARNDPAGWKRIVYMNLWMRLTQFQYQNDGIEPSLDGIKSEILVDGLGVQWWHRNRDRYLSDARSDVDTRFVNIIDKACEELEKALVTSAEGGSSAER